MDRPEAHHAEKAMTPEELERLEAEADEALKQLTTAPEEDKPEEAEEEGAELTAPDEPETKVEPDTDPETEPKAEEQSTAEDNSESFEVDGVEESVKEQILNAQASYENARKKMTQATMEASDLRKKNESLQADVAMLKAQMLQVQQQPVAATDVEEPKRPDDLATLVEEYGEDFNPLVNSVRSQRDTITSLSDKLKSIEEANVAAADRASRDAHNAAIVAKHPDAFDLVNTDDFQGWSLRQPPEVRDILKSGSADSVNWVLDSYKKAVTPSANSKPDETARKQQLLDDARQAADPTVSTVRSDPGAETAPRFTREQIDKMSMADFEKYSDVIDQQLAAGQL